MSQITLDIVVVVVVVENNRELIILKCCSLALRGTLGVRSPAIVR